MNNVSEASHFSTYLVQRFKLTYDLWLLDKQEIPQSNNFPANQTIAI